jgi:hypothetical protein
MLRTLRQIHRRLEDESGAVAVMTLLFVSMAGMLVIATLWGIGFATGVYDQQVNATQAAAYAAVSQTPVDDSASTPLGVNCSDSGATSITGVTNCNSGAAWVAAMDTLNSALPGSFGAKDADLNGNSGIQIYNPSDGNADEFQAYDVQEPYGQAKADDPGCSGSSSGELTCWKGDADGTLMNEYVSGVNVTTRTVNVSFPQGCSGSFFCFKIPLTVTETAVVGQVPNS